MIDKPTTIARALQEGRERLLGSATETPRLDAEVLLRSLLGLDRAALFSRLQDPIDTDAVQAYRNLIGQRSDGIPVAYLTGEREFMGIRFKVGPGVLIPRPETEILVEWALDWLRARPRVTVVDVGTGSGAIALSLAQLLEPAWRGQIIGADISSVAIETARLNRHQLGLEQWPTLVQGSLLEWLGGPVDLILANLPYLRPDQIEENPDLKAEPRLALDGGQDGLELIERLLADAPRVLRAQGAVGLEIDPGQTDKVIRQAKQAFPRSEVTVLQDLAGLERHVIVQTEASPRNR